MKIAVVTGASSGMGREFVFAIDKQFELDEIWVIARRENRLIELQSQCKTKIRPVTLDLQQRENYSVYKEMLETEKPEISVLVNGAGFGLFGSFEKIDLDKQLDIIDINEKALTAMCYISMPFMPAGSHLVNICSNSSWQPVPYINVYGSTKAYALNFTKALEWELRNAGKGIHVMAVCPGWIQTEFFDHAVSDDTISYYDHIYTPDQVIKRAMKDMKKHKSVSIMGFPVRMQVRLVKLLPMDWVIKIWCKQQKKC